MIFPAKGRGFYLKMVAEEKKQQVEALSAEMAASDAVILADYSGLTVSDIQGLRGKLADLGASFKVIKNTLIGISFEKAGLKDGELEGPSAILISGKSDPIEAIKTLVATLKEKGKGEVKFGFFEKAFMDSGKVLELATLPGKQVLQARFVSKLISPVYRLANALSYNQRSLVVVLDQIAKSKGGAENG